ncbi:MAG: inositol monophosphatase family protein [Spirochaetota bacterium]
MPTHLLSSKDLDRFLNVAARAAVRAGTAAHKRFGKARNIKRKGAIDLVTEADKAAEKLIRAAIEKKFPHHSFYGEESGRDLRTSEFVWVVDPIDGTTNFVHGYPFYAVSIGLVFQGETVLGCVYEPLTKSLYTAHTKASSKKNGRVIHVSRTARLIDSLMITGFYYNVMDNTGYDNMLEFNRIVKCTQGVRRDGSAVLDLCRVAEGAVEGFWEYSLAPWDVCAGGIIVQKAGGTVSGLDGKPYDIHSRKCIVASNGRVHGKFIRALKGRSAWHPSSVPSGKRPSVNIIPCAGTRT